MSRADWTQKDFQSTVGKADYSVFARFALPREWMEQWHGVWIGTSKDVAGCFNARCYSLQWCVSLSTFACTQTFQLSQFSWLKKINIFHCYTSSCVHSDHYNVKHSGQTNSPPYLMLLCKTAFKSSRTFALSSPNHSLWSYAREASHH